MSSKNPLVLIFGLCCFAIPTLAQRNELSLSVGASIPTDQNSTSVGLATFPVITNNLANSSGVAFIGNFSRRITSFGPASFYLEAPVVGGPGRNTTVSFRTGQFLGDLVTLSSSSFFFTPSAKIKFLDSSRISPFVSVGGGLAHLGFGTGTTKNTGALQYGGGLDYKSPLPHLGFRAEVRDFFSPTVLQSTTFLQVSPTHQHVVFAGGGAVFRF